MSLYKRKDSSVWWVKLHHSGKIVQRSTGIAEKVKAQEYHDRLKSSLWEQERLGVRPRYSWEKAAGRWLEETADKATHKQDIAYLKWLHPTLGDLMLDEITLDVIAGIKETRLQEASKSTANRYLATIRTILRKARDEWEWVERVPKIRLFKESEGRTRFITPEQVQALLRELPAHQQDMVLFALQTGLRQANVVKLEWSQVNLEQGHMWVNAAQSKNRKPISVPLNREALAALRRQLGKHPVRVFTFAGQPIVNANTRAFRNALKRAGIEDFRWHDLRHTWASWHRMQGTPRMNCNSLAGGRQAQWWNAMPTLLLTICPDRLLGWIRCWMATIWLRSPRNKKAPHRCKALECW